MDAIKMIEERRSVRKFKDKKVSEEKMKKIISISRWAPSWGNFQIARYTHVNNNKLITEIATKGVDGFVYNRKTLTQAPSLVVLSFVKGKSGMLDKNGNLISKSNIWEVFDAGIACQTFCLAAHAEGLGTFIMSVIEENSIASILNLPKEETVAALIVCGYEDGEHGAPTSRKRVDEILRYIG